jgi:hypothetical protein
MTQYRQPGPLGSGCNLVAIDAGTLALTRSPPPGCWGALATDSAQQPAAERPQARRAVIDVDAAVRKIEQIALQDYTGRCAAHVRQALEAGGADMSVRPVYAKDYGPRLLEIGFTAVSATAYAPAKGDVVVFQDYPGQRVPAGHIQMYSGTAWVSDTVQPRFLPHQRHYKDVAYAIYRP